MLDVNRKFIPRFGFLTCDDNASTQDNPVYIPECEANVLASNLLALTVIELMKNIMAPNAETFFTKIKRIIP